LFIVISYVVSSCSRKAKTRRGKRFLESRQPKIVENDKNAVIVKGGKTNQTVSSALADLYALKKPLALHLKRHNPIHPFENDVDLEKFAMKYDASLFLVGFNSKKHPNSLIFGRMYDYHVLDMVELQIKSLVESKQFKTARVPVGCKPCIILQGTEFESNDTMKRIGNLMVDWFRGAKVENIRLQGLELVISLTAIEDNIHFRVYRTQLKKSTGTLPRVELVEIGPRIDFSVRRNKFASESLFRTATKQPKQLLAKRRKNRSTDVFGTELGRVHVGKQNIDGMQTKKLKALRGPKNKKKSQES
uniref:Ribosome production factor 2 homolog n=1 Tax=Gongylonema pulchrum TaxID=637853 RepID=A0A183E2E1_9BILA